ncbi:MAG: twin-arginine translocation signal domain-containing protein [Sphingopyxis sp.]
MSDKKPIDRRSFLSTVAGAAALMGGSALFISGEAEARRRRTSGITDQDSRDQAGNGRGRTGLTDRDSRDVAGNGRYGNNGVSDGDRGRGSDPTGRGVRGHPRGTTDSDPTDGSGRGRGGGTGRTDSDPTDSSGRGQTGRTDSDPTDGSGRGRGGRTVDRDPSDPGAAGASRGFRS